MAHLINCSRSSKYLESSLGLELLKVGAVHSLHIGMVYDVAIVTVVDIGWGIDRIEYGFDS